MTGVEWLVTVSVYIYLAIFFFMLYVVIRHPTAYERCEYFCAPVTTVLAFIVGAWCLNNDLSWISFEYAGICAFSAWRWWNNDHHRHKRRRLMNRLAGRVRDVGGRLKVVRPQQ